ncbi:MAG: peptidoglycan DD-metalloendopeptidase family protein [Flavobacteriales bacterium]|nr:peptidoglycan DD-metalloendopeptidase family protein [Flavobacteriales bacterium]
MERWKKWSLSATTAAVAVLVVFYADPGPRPEYVAEPEVTVEADTVPNPPRAYGIPLSGFVLESFKMPQGSTFSEVLGEHGFNAAQVDSLVQASKAVYNVRNLRAGHPMALIFTDDGAREPHYLVYESDPVEHVIFDLRPPYGARLGRKPVHTEERDVHCVVQGALYNDMSGAGGDAQLALQLAEVFAWTVDFQRIQKGDQFTVTYMERSVEGRPFGQPIVIAARYESGGVVKDAYRFRKSDGEIAYFDAEGNSLRKAFLKAPLKFSRVSSGFSSRRLHPVQKRFKAHLGTDYAAPYGTPILAVGDGVVEQAGYGAGNGNYVKVRHNGTYSTQYLHMRKILVKQGQRVQQGQVIGEVGSTGLATGPHVCFRFWKNGVQVDHRREEFPSAEPVPTADRERFHGERDRYAVRLSQVRERQLAAF